MFERFTDSARRPRSGRGEDAQPQTGSAPSTSCSASSAKKKASRRKRSSRSASRYRSCPRASERDGWTRIRGRRRSYPVHAESEEGPRAVTPRAQQLGDTYIGTEHLLLGLIREGEGIGAQVLQGLDADLNLVRSRVIEMVTGEAASDREDPMHCPRCDADLAESAFWRTITVPEEGERAARPVSFVFCRRCSLTLGIIPAD